MSTGSIMMAMLPGEKHVLRGKVKSALAMLWISGRVAKSMDLDPTKFPYMINNMDAWFKLAYKELAYPDLVDAWLHARHTLEYSVNDGTGAKEGRGSNENLFSYTLKHMHSLRIDIRFITEPHQAIYQRRVKAGVHVPKKKATLEEQLAKWGIKPGEPYMLGDTINWPIKGSGDSDMVATYTTDAEKVEFYDEHPEWAGRVRVIGG